MKILYIHQYFKFPDEEGGTRSYDLATSFVKNNHSVVVLASTSKSNLHGKKRWEVVERDGIEVHYIYIPYSNSLSYIKRLLVFFKFLWFTSFHSLRIKVDVVLATSTPLTIGIPALLKKWFDKTPYIFETRDVWPEAVIAIGAIKNRLVQKLLYQLERIIYKNASAIVPLSIDMQKSIIDRYPKFTNKTKTVIPNISEINRFHNSSDLVDLKEKLGFRPRFAVLYAGTMGKVNGIEYVIRLAEKTILLDPKLVYIFIMRGDGNSVIQLAKERNIYDKNVFFFDTIAKNELPAWYNSVSMGSSFVINIKELWANSANKFFDTLAASKPVLINHKGWQADVIENKNIGYVLPVNLTDCDAEAFVTYTKNIELYDIQCMNAFKVAKENYSLEVAIKKYLKVVNDVFA